MPRAFGAGWNSTNTASTTVPQGHLVGAATHIVRLYEVNTGSDATADNAAEYGITRTTSRGGTSGYTSVPAGAASLDSTGVSASFLDYGWTTGLPAITSATNYMLSWGQHQRATYRWVAYDYTKMLQTVPAAGAGLALLSVTVSATFNAVYHFSWEE